MTQPAQSSGHEWTPQGTKGLGRCSCGYGTGVLVDRRQWQIHQASVAQAAQPHVPEPYIEYGRGIETTCECLLRCSCGWDEGDHGKMKEHPGATWLEHIQSVYPPRDAQPQEVPAEQRPVCDCPKPGPCLGTGGLGKPSLCADTQPASAAKPAEDGLRQCHAGECKDEMIWRDVIALRNAEQEKRADIDAERGIYPDVAPAPVHSMEPETTAEPKKGGYATLMTSMETLTALYPEKFPETPEETEKRRNREWAEYLRERLEQEQEQQKTPDYLFHKEKE